MCGGVLSFLGVNWVGGGHLILEWSLMLGVQVMRNATLEAEMEEMGSKIKALEGRRRVYRGCICAAGLFFLAVQFPDAMEELLTDFTVVSHVLTGVCTVVAMRVLF